MKRRQVLCRVSGACLAMVPQAASAQQAAKRPTIGLLLSESLEGQASRLTALRAGLRERGYVEGRDIAIEIRSAAGDYDRLSRMAVELARLKVDVLVAFGSKATLAAKAAASATPIVAPVLGDPAALGVTSNLARPDGNVTGSAILSVELFAKQIQLLKELVPQTARVALLVNPANAASETQPMEEARHRAANGLRIEFQRFNVRSSEQLASAFAAIAKARFDGVYVSADTLFRAQAGEVARLAALWRLPSVGAREFADAGGLIGYGANDAELHMRGTYFIDRLLSGARVGELPIEQATRFDLVLNRRTARSLGITISQSALLRADEVIQ